MRYLYLALAAVGLVIPFVQFVPFVAENGLNISLIIAQMFANRIA